MKPSNLLNQIKIGLQVILPIAVLFLSFGSNGVNPAYAVVDCTGAVTLTLRTSSGGTISPVTPAPDCAGKYSLGSVVQLTASPSATFSFIGWRNGYNNASLGTTNPLSVTIPLVIDNAHPAPQVTAIFSIPSNDAFASAKVINSITYTDTLDTIGATQAVTDPNNVGTPNFCSGHAMITGNNTVWYKYTPSVNESIAVDTIGSKYTNPLNGFVGDMDTYVAVWTGTEGALTLVSCNDDSFTGLTSQLSFIGNASTPYYFEVASFNGTTTCTIPDPISGICGQQLGGSLKFNVNITNTDVTTGGTKQRSYYLNSNSTTIDSYSGIFDGPVQVTSSIAQKFFTSERTIYGNSFNETGGIPDNQLTTKYWFPWYDDVYMGTWINVGNPSATTNADVSIYIAGVLKGSFSIPPNGRWTPDYPGVFNGPVQVVSTNAQNFFVSERTIYQGSFNETSGIPDTPSTMTTKYWFPWYDFVYMQTWLNIGNPSATTSANVSVYIAGTLKESSIIPPNGRWTPSYPGVFNGPVQVVSTNGQNIFVSERTLYGNSFNETSGIPDTQLTTKYWFPYYDNQSMQTWINVGNPSASTNADVSIYIGGTLKGSFSIPPNGRWTPNYAGLPAGPVQVVSTNAQNFFVSERTLYKTSFDEMTGIPDNQLTTKYWFPWYDYKYMQTYIHMGTP